MILERAERVSRILGGKIKKRKVCSQLAEMEYYHKTLIEKEVISSCIMEYVLHFYGIHLRFLLRTTNFQCII